MRSTPKRFKQLAWPRRRQPGPGNVFDPATGVESIDGAGCQLGLCRCSPDSSSGPDGDGSAANYPGAPPFPDAGQRHRQGDLPRFEGCKSQGHSPRDVQPTAARAYSTKRVIAEFVPGSKFTLRRSGLPHGGGYPSSQRRLWSRITVKWYCQLA